VFALGNADLRGFEAVEIARLETAEAMACQNPNNKKAPDDAGAFELRFSRDQYLAATGAPVQLKR
jgi:hypothetical protein